MAEQNKKLGSFTKINQLRPFDTGLNLTVKVVSAKMIVQRGRSQGRFAECLVGDETGMIIFAARNDQGFILFYLCLINLCVSCHLGLLPVSFDFSLSLIMLCHSRNGFQLCEVASFNLDCEDVQVTFGIVCLQCVLTAWVRCTFAVTIEIML